MTKNAGVIGVSDHGGWAVFVTVAADGTVLDRRRVELVDEALPSIPHHQEGQLLALDDAVALVERVRASAERHAALALDAVAKAVPHIAGIALRRCPELPPTIAERLADYRARNVADWVMYRKALALAAEGRGWPVHWYDSKTVFDSASRLLQIEDFDGHFLQLRRKLGPPWNNDHKLAMAAAISAQNEPCRGGDNAELTTLFRPVGPAELQLIQESGYRSFPPRLPEQPIFYPVLNQAYAAEIASKWNVRDDGCAYVTRFQVRRSFLDRYEVQQVGNKSHVEYWIPAEELPEFNAAIVGLIAVVKSFGEK